MRPPFRKSRRAYPSLIRPPQQHHRMHRREFLIIPAAAMGGSLLHFLARESARVEVHLGLARIPLRFFTADEARVVSAACERILPRDATGPGATDASVVIYIDRQLAGPYGRDRHRYTKGPFTASVPEHGYQGADDPQHLYRAGIAALGDFASLAPGSQDDRLAAIEATRFFALLRAHTIEGMFCDPMHGGNADMAGWKLVGYPGPQLSYHAHVDQHFGVAYRPKPAHLRQLTGLNAPLLEDEVS